MMRSLSFAVPILAAFALAACANFPGNTTYLDELNAATPTGSPFSQALSVGYKGFAQEERDEYDWLAQQRYARKGLDAAHGTVDQPENPADWSIDDPQAAQDLAAARTRLMAALASDAPNRDPSAAAIAQVKFECWLHEQWEGWQMDEIKECRDGFLAAMSELEAKPRPVAAAVPPAPAPAPAPMANLATAANFTVFFDFDRSDIKPEAAPIIAAAARAFKAGHEVKIKVTGYCDTVGTFEYNVKLSFRRSGSVKAELVKDGIDASAIVIDGKGKTDLLVPTADGVREPKNRRAVIEFAGQ